MTDSETFALYVLDRPPSIQDELPAGYTFSAWHPSLRQPVPPSLGWKFSTWTLFHFAHLFPNREYHVVYVRCGGRIVHRSCVLPRYFRWPFMSHQDLHVSSTWTEPEFRGRGLASVALAHVATTMLVPGRRIWYATRKSNIPSIRTCTRVGFTLSGYARRTATVGLRSLGQLTPIVKSPLPGESQI